MPISGTRFAQKYLIVPAMPAPNGRLHLGHIAGPYLRLDILARHLRRRGDHASIVCATDPYDSYIPLRAEQAGIDPSALAQASCAGIVEDLQNMEIEVECFIDPLSEENREHYLSAHTELVNRLVRQGSVSSVYEKIPYSPTRDVFVSGSFLVGKCPKCGEGISGFFCEDCGAHFQPENVIDPISRWGEVLEYRTQDNLFFDIKNPDGLMTQLERTATSESFIAIARHHIESDGARFRLTNHPGWGLPWVLDQEKRTLFGHGLLFAAIRFVGEIYAKKTGLSANPFDRESDVITVNGFGIDNCVSHLVGIQSMAIADGISKPFDRFIINHFYTLEGKKFSTSMRWAIWVDDIAKKTRIPADAVRFFLSTTNPVESSTDFDCVAFLDFVNGPYTDIRNYVSMAIEAIHAVPVPATPATLLKALAEKLDAQELALQFSSFDPRAACLTIVQWASIFITARDSGNLYWWVKGMALLACPVMPTLSREIWHALGHTGDPSNASFIDSPALKLRPIPNFEPILLIELSAALPAAMTEISDETCT